MRIWMCWRLNENRNISQRIFDLLYWWKYEICCHWDNGGIYLTKLSWVFFRKYCLFVHTFRIHCLWFSCLIFGSCNKRNLPYLTKYQCTHNRNTRILLSMIYYQLIHLEFFNAIDEEIQTTYIEHWTRRKDTHYNKS